MTPPRMEPQNVVEKADCGEFLHKLIRFAAQRLLDLEGEASVCAGYGERSRTARWTATAAATSAKHHESYTISWDTTCCAVQADSPTARVSPFPSALLLRGQRTSIRATTDEQRR